MRIVIAIGGNALLKKNETQSADTLKHNSEIAANSIAKLAQAHDIIIVHGNGPQVGMLAIQQSNYPFDILDAESQGMIGYVLQQSLNNALPTGKLALSLLTQVIVAANDPAFKHPSKPIGPYYPTPENSRNWSFVQHGNEWRRVVASPKPQKIVELSAIQLLSQAGYIVIAAGGGGIPCTETDSGGTTGIEAVIDKDLTAARLALDIAADQLIILTDVDGVYEHWGTPQQTRLQAVSATSLMQHTFESGSMGPKIQAACEFVTDSGKTAIIGHLEQLPQLMQQQTGTVIKA